MINKKILLGVIFSVVFFLSTLNALNAANLQDAFGPASSLDVEAKTAGYNISTVTFLGTVSKVIEIILSILGVAFLVLLIYGGFLWMTARGNEQQVEKAKDTIFSSIIGLIIVLGAYSISIFVVTKLTANTLIAQ